VIVTSSNSRTTAPVAAGRPGQRVGPLEHHADEPAAVGAAQGGLLGGELPVAVQHVGRAVGPPVFEEVAAAVGEDENLRVARTA